MERLSPKEASQFTEALLSWYQAHHRPLPWRKTRDPYRIWVAEVMLQQTQAATVKPYYERFIEAFPTVAHLARAPLDPVLKLWEGLGYYARARHLQRAAQLVVERHGGRVPDDRRALLELPGVGPYTAAAVLSIAFGQDEPVLDGNVRRVMSRVLLVEEDPRTPQAERRLLSALRSLLPAGRAGAFNQALMELGSTRCAPSSPRCPRCPVAAFCRAKRLAHQEELPVKVQGRARPHHEAAVGLIWRDGKLLLARRPREGLLGGLWELPGGKRKPGERLEDCLRREVREELGIEIEIRGRGVAVRHGYTHFSVTLHPFECEHRAGEPRALGCTAWTWVEPDRLNTYALPRASAKVLAAGLGPRSGGDQEREKEEEQQHLDQEEQQIR